MIRVDFGFGILNSYSDLLAVSKSALPLTVALPYAARCFVPFHLFSNAHQALRICKI
jgi:hypothetical protein